MYKPSLVANDLGNTDTQTDVFGNSRPKFVGGFRAFCINQSSSQPHAGSIRRWARLWCWMLAPIGLSSYSFFHLPFCHYKVEIHSIEQRMRWAYSISDEWANKLNLHNPKLPITSLTGILKVSMSECRFGVRPTDAALLALKSWHKTKPFIQRLTNHQSRMV